MDITKLLNELTGGLDEKEFIEKLQSIEDIKITNDSGVTPEIDDEGVDIDGLNVKIPNVDKTFKIQKMDSGAANLVVNDNSVSETPIKPTHVLSTDVKKFDENGSETVETLEINAILEAGKFYKVDDNTKGGELGNYDGSAANFLYDNKEWTVTAVSSEGGRRRSRKSNKKSKKSKGGKKSSRKSRKSRRSRKSRK